MGNGIDFRKLALDLRGQLTTVQSELAVLNEHIELLTADLAWSENDSRDQSKELAALREELAIIKDECIDHVNLHKAWTKQRDDMQQRRAAEFGAGRVALTDEQIIEVMHPALDLGDGGYLCDTGPEFVVKAGRALIAKLNQC